MTDNGLAALAAALEHEGDACSYDAATDSLRCPGSEAHIGLARRLLGERGVFLPDGLPEVSIKGLLEDFDGAPYPEDFQRAVAVREADYLGQIATLRAALGLPGALCEWIVNRGDRCKADGVDVRERNPGEWTIVCDRHRAALAHAKEAE
jgi:hypothetical protein